MPTFLLTLQAHIGQKEVLDGRVTLELCLHHYSDYASKFYSEGTAQQTV